MTKKQQSAYDELIEQLTTAGYHPTTTVLTDESVLVTVEDDSMPARVYPNGEVWFEA